MAIDVTALAPTIEMLGLTGLDDIGRARSMVPRQQLTATVVSAAVAQPGAGDNASFTVTVDLPANFAYILVGFHASIYTATATNQWENQGTMYTRVTTKTGTRKYNKFMSLQSPGSNSFGVAQQKVYTPAQLDREVLLGDDAKLIAQITNANDADVAVTVDVIARFLVYDVAQALHWAVNTPSLVR